MTKSILFTADKDLSASFLQPIQEQSVVQLLHLPLENFEYSLNEEEHGYLLENMESFSFIVYGNLRNARYFLQWASENSQLEKIQEFVHLAPNQPCIDLLESKKIPGIMPREDARPIDIIEFLLRISREGNVLYPTKKEKGEETPGLLQELEIPAMEFEVCCEVSLEDRELQKLRSKVRNVDLDAVLFHSRSSVTRILTAFPDLDFNSVRSISAGKQVSQKLNESGITPDKEANSTWRSLTDILID